MRKNILIVVLLIVVVWFGSAIVRLENERYALSLDMCGTLKPEDVSKLSERQDCLRSVETRTGAMYHLLYGLKLI
jgi:hypothetical protein